MLRNIENIVNYKNDSKFKVGDLVRTKRIEYTDYICHLVATGFVEDMRKSKVLKIIEINDKLVRTPEGHLKEISIFRLSDDYWYCSWQFEKWYNINEVEV